MKLPPHTKLNIQPFSQVKKPKATVKTELLNIVTMYKISSVYLIADLQLFLMLTHLVLK